MATAWMKQFVAVLLGLLGVARGGRVQSDEARWDAAFTESESVSDYIHTDNLFGNVDDLSGAAAESSLAKTSNTLDNPLVGGFDITETDEDNGFVVDSSARSTDPSTVSLASQSGDGCATGNPIDDCWMCDPDWASHLQSLANCAVGFGRRAIGGKNGRIYVVTSPQDGDPATPVPGTLRHAVTRPGPLWITFASSMIIYLNNELIMTSFKTVDGRGVNVSIVGGAGFTLQYVSNIIIHGIAIHDITPTGPARIMISTSYVGDRGRSDGDAISILTSHDLWIDHCYLARAADGLIDVIRGSTRVTISNNYFTDHDKVMLLGANKEDYEDRAMRVTVAYNIFGPGLVQRMPRMRFGSVHVVNNYYTSGWGIYAIGGSENPTILSEGNLFNPEYGPKLVTKRIDDGGNMFGGIARWNWKSIGDVFQSGAYFVGSGAQFSAQPYATAYSCSARPASLVPRMTSKAGPPTCPRGSRC